MKRETVKFFIMFNFLIRKFGSEILRHFLVLDHIVTRKKYFPRSCSLVALFFASLQKCFRGDKRRRHWYREDQYKILFGTQNSFYSLKPCMNNIENITLFSKQHFSWARIAGNIYDENHKIYIWHTDILS